MFLQLGGSVVLGLICSECSQLGLQTLATVDDINAALP